MPADVTCRCTSLLPTLAREETWAMQRSFRVTECSAPKGTILVVYDISHLGRCLEVFGVIEVLLKAGVQIYSVFEDLLVTWAHKLVVNAIEYSNQLLRRVKDAYAMKKRRKVFIGHKGSVRVYDYGCCW